MVPIPGSIIKHLTFLPHPLSPIFPHPRPHLPIPSFNCRYLSSMSKSQSKPHNSTTTTTTQSLSKNTNPKKPQIPYLFVYGTLRKAYTELQHPDVTFRPPEELKGFGEFVAEAYLPRKSCIVINLFLNRGTEYSEMLS